ncbi:unnamed protein product [Caretta caretta]
MRGAGELINSRMINPCSLQIMSHYMGSSGSADGETPLGCFIKKHAQDNSTRSGDSMIQHCGSEPSVQPLIRFGLCSE